MSQDLKRYSEPSIFPQVPNASYQEIYEATLKHVNAGGEGVARQMNVNPRAFTLKSDGVSESYDAALAITLENTLIAGIYPDARTNQPNPPRVEARLVRQELIPAHTQILQLAGINPTSVNLVSFDINVKKEDGERLLISGSEAFNWCIAVTPLLIRLAKADKKKPTIFIMDLELGSHDYSSVAAGFKDPNQSLEETLQNTWAYRQFARHNYGKLIGLSDNTFIYGNTNEHALNFFLAEGDLSDSPSSVPVSKLLAKSHRIITDKQQFVSPNSSLPFAFEG